MKRTHNASEKKQHFAGGTVESEGARWRGLFVFWLSALAIWVSRA